MVGPFVNEAGTPKDMLATLTHLTARSIAQAVDPLHMAVQVYVCGGGAKNTLLMKCLSAYLPEKNVQGAGVLGIDPQLVEALTFAYLAKRHVDDTPIDMRLITGAKRPYTPGVWYPA